MLEKNREEGLKVVRDVNTWKARKIRYYALIMWGNTTHKNNVRNIFNLKIYDVQNY